MVPYMCCQSSLRADGATRLLVIFTLEDPICCSPVGGLHTFPPLSQLIKGGLHFNTTTYDQQRSHTLLRTMWSIINPNERPI